MSKAIDREISVAFCYRGFARTAKRFRYEFQLPSERPGEPAVVLFVGNHSSASRRTSTI